MRTSVMLPAVLAVLGGFLAELPSARADLTPAHRRELRELETEIRRVSVLIRGKDFEEAEKKLQEIEETLETIQKEAKVADKDRPIANIKRVITLQRNQLRKTKPADPNDAQAMGVSFTNDVQPILTKNCGSCHGATGNARGNLRLNSFENLKRGGGSGALLSVGNANQSLIMRRITAPDDQKMPPGNRPRLSNEDIQTIRDWINQGAKDDTGKAPPKPGLEKVEIPKPTGKETVSFTKDIAPFMVNLCMGCHSGNNPRGGLSLTTVNNMMQGGNSGRVIIPGDREGSRLFRLVGGLENPRMPQNQARITRKNYEDLKKWFDEGNKFDVDDPDKPLREIVPTEEEILAERLAKLSDEEFAQHRMRRSQDVWSDALNEQPYRWLETRDFLVYGDADDSRLQQIAEWADDHAEELRKTFGEEDAYLWRGKLAIFVIKDRFDFEQFSSVNLGQEAPEEMFGFARVTSTSDEAYIALHDIGDEASETEPGMQTNLIEQLTAAYLQKDGGENLPAWVTRGLGLYFAAQAQSKSPYFPGLRTAAPGYVQTLPRNSPGDVFKDGTFSPSAVGAVGYTLTDFLIKRGNPRKFGALIRSLKKGTKPEEAIQAVYGANPNNVAAQYINSLRGGRRN